MELAIRVHVERLPEGPYLGTSEDVQGLVVQADTVAEVLEIARSVAKALIEARTERDGKPDLNPVGQEADYTIVVAA